MRRRAMGLGRWSGARGAGAAGLGLLVALALPGVASAAVVLPDGDVVVGSAPADYTFQTTTHYWSVVAVQPKAGDVNLALYTATGRTALNGSRMPAGMTEFVAVNSNAGFRALGYYRASVTPAYDSPVHVVQQQQGHTVTYLPVPAWDGVSGAGDPDITFAVLGNENVVTVADIYLTAGEKFWAHTTMAGTSLYLLESDPANPHTFTRSRKDASTAQHTVVDGCTLYTATYTGWHGLAMVDDRMPTKPGAGIAFALHRWRASTPTTCPVKNFPDPTPA